MAKGPQKQGGGPARVRFVMLDAELPEGGDLSQITQAIQNALKPTMIVQQRVTNGAATKTIAHVSQEQTDVVEEATAEEELQQQDAGSTAVPRQRGPRKPPSAPQILTDVDLTSDPSLASYAAKANPKSHLKRYLVITAWFKEHRQIESVGVEHIYTGYRHLKWPTDIKDFAQPLRDLKADQYLSSSEKGSYTINHLGLQEVQKLLDGGE
jgi:hypothetical protein